LSYVNTKYLIGFRETGNEQNWWAFEVGRLLPCLHFVDTEVREREGGREFGDETKSRMQVTVGVAVSARNTKR
jgi:hypothetical protein